MREQIVRIGANELVGIVTEPPAGQAASANRPGVILINSGLIQRVGPNRLYVRLARRLAAQGFTVLRFDLSAIGDSPRRLDNLPFEQSSVAETREAMETLSDGWGVDTFLLAGICTGAVVALRTALKENAVQGIGMINAQGLLSERAPEVSQYLTQTKAGHYYCSQALFKPDSWKKLATGRANVGAIARAAGQRLGRLLGRKPQLDSPEAQEVAHDLLQLGRDNRNLLLLYSEGDPGIDELNLILGDLQGGLKKVPGARFETIPRADHMFTPLDSQSAFCDRLENWTREITQQTTETSPLASQGLPEGPKIHGQAPIQRRQGTL